MINYDRESWYSHILHRWRSKVNNSSGVGWVPDSIVLVHECVTPECVCSLVRGVVVHSACLNNVPARRFLVSLGNDNKMLMNECSCGRFDFLSSLFLSVSLYPSLSLSVSLSLACILILHPRTSSAVWMVYTSCRVKETETRHVVSPMENGKDVLISTTIMTVLETISSINTLYL